MAEAANWAPKVAFSPTERFHILIETEMRCLGKKKLPYGLREPSS